MVSLTMRKILTAAFLICLPVTSTLAREIPVSVGKNYDFTLTCRVGNFIGVVEGAAGNNYYIGKWVDTKRYKITRINGQKGGNKANVNLNAGKAPSFSRDNVVYSPNRMIQDGNWHDLRLSRMYFADRNTRSATSYEFIFDKSGRDPSCWTEVLNF